MFPHEDLQDHYDDFVSYSRLQRSTLHEQLQTSTMTSSTATNAVIAAQDRVKFRRTDFVLKNLEAALNRRPTRQKLLTAEDILSLNKALVTACGHHDERLKTFADQLSVPDAYNIMFPYQQGCGTVQDDLRNKLSHPPVYADQAKEYIDDAVKQTHLLAVNCEKQLCARIKAVADLKKAELDAQRKRDAERAQAEAQRRHEETLRKKKAEEDRRIREEDKAFDAERERFRVAQREKAEAARIRKEAEDQKRRDDEILEKNKQLAKDAAIAAKKAARVIDELRAANEADDKKRAEQLNQFVQQLMDKYVNVADVPKPPVKAATPTPSSPVPDVQPDPQPDADPPPAPRPVNAALLPAAPVKLRLPTGDTYQLPPNSLVAARYVKDKHKRRKLILETIPEIAPLAEGTKLQAPSVILPSAIGFRAAKADDSKQDKAPRKHHYKDERHKKDDDDDKPEKRDGDGGDKRERAAGNGGKRPGKDEPSSSDDDGDDEEYKKRQRRLRQRERKKKQRDKIRKKLQKQQDWTMTKLVIKKPR
jgi:hypothetical protein